MIDEVIKESRGHNDSLTEESTQESESETPFPPIANTICGVSSQSSYEVRSNNVVSGRHFLF